MSDVAYIMEKQDPRELWLVDGENRFRVSRDMYMLLASNGADLPPTYDIADVMEENAKLRELVRILCHCMQINAKCDDCRLNGAKGELALDPLCACDGLHKLLREIGIEVD